MEYLQTLCFAGVNSKRRDLQQEKREKQQLQQSLSRQSSVCCDKRLSKWLEKCVATIFFVSQHKIQKLVDELCRNKRSKNWQMSYLAIKESMSRHEMGRSQLRQRSVMLRHNERSEGRIYVATESTLSRH